MCDSWLALKRSSSLRHGIRSVCDAAPAGEKAKRRKDGEPGIKESTSASTCDGDSRGNHEGGAKCSPETALNTETKVDGWRAGSRKSSEERMKGKKSKLGSDGGVFPTSESLEKSLC